MKKDRRFTDNQKEDDEFFEDEIVEIDISEIEDDEEEISTPVDSIEDDIVEEERRSLEALEDHLVRKTSRHKTRKKGFYGAIIVAVVAFLVLVGVMVERNTPSKKVADLYSYFGMEADSGETALIVNYSQVEAAVLVKDGIYYIDQSYIQSDISDKFYYDSESDAILYTTDTSVYKAVVGGSEYTLGDERFSEDYVISFWDNDILYLAVNYLDGKVGFTWQTFDDPSRLAIVLDGLDLTQTVLKDQGKIRLGADIKSDIIGNASKEDTIWILTQGDGAPAGWSMVSTMDGRIGYIKAEDISSTDGAYEVRSDYTAPEYADQVKNYDVLLVWHAVYSATDNGDIEELLSSTKNVTTVSPTWYKVTDAVGGISSFADKDYVAYIHAQGMEIWPLISDFTSADAENGWDEKAMLGSQAARTALINTLMKEADNYGYDGFNIDFEKVPKDAGPDYIQFIRELSIACRARELVLSIDNYVPMSFNLYYNRQAQGECADYVIVMGYDEHYSGDTEAGSVSSIDFVTSGIDNTLAEVPAKKVINALPFYTRLWTDGVDEEGNQTLTSKSYSMQGGLDLIEELGLTKVWDDTVQQYVAKGSSGETSYRIWLEEEKSMKAKMAVVKARSIGGVAAWSLGMELDTVWDIIGGN